MARAKVWLLETRPHFLLLVPASVLTGAAAAFHDLGGLNAAHLALAFMGALLAHIAVNVLNDYFDFRSGIDLRTQRTPFSGGSGILPAGLLRPKEVFVFGLVSLLVLVPIGGYFWSRYGWDILPLGLAGMLVIYFYTTHITRSPWLCLVAPGLGFGPLMVLGTYFTQAGGYSWTAAAASLVPGFLVSNLLLLNQFPDVEADRVARRRHLPITLGNEKCAIIYSGILLATYVLLPVFAVLGVLPWLALLGVITVPLSIAVIKGVLRYYNQTEKLVPSMGRNVIVTLATPVFMSVGIIMGSVLA